MANTASAQYSATGQPTNLPFIIGASSVGTLIEWYDFYLYGVLALFLQPSISSRRRLRPGCRVHR